MSYSPWGHKESDTTERLNHHHHHHGLGTQKDSRSWADLKSFPKLHTHPLTQGRSLTGTRGLSITSDQLLAEHLPALAEGQLLGSQA